MSTKVLLDQSATPVIELDVEGIDLRLLRGRVMGREGEVVLVNG